MRLAGVVCWPWHLGSVCGVAAVPGPSSAEARAGLILRIYAALVLQKSRFRQKVGWTLLWHAVYMRLAVWDAKPATLILSKQAWWTWCWWSTRIEVACSEHSCGQGSEGPASTPRYKASVQSRDWLQNTSGAAADGRRTRPSSDV